MTIFWLSLAGAAIVIVAALLLFRARRRIPELLQRGRPLPDFSANDERGDPVRSTQLHGSPTVMVFVRGNWCPFCTRQVKDLTSYYKDIVDLGARLIFVTPQPLETTRRVAEFFEVEFDFWLDPSLEVTRKLGLLAESGVPDEFRREYGADTVWPASIVIDAAGIIRYVELSRQITDRPNPKTLLRELRRAVSG